MPGGDKTGPHSQGPKTGRTAGYCAGYNIPGYMNTSMPRIRRARRIGFRGRNRMQTRGLGWRYGLNFDEYHQPPKLSEHTQPSEINIEDEKNMLQEHLRNLETQKEILQKRLDVLTKKTDKNPTTTEQHNRNTKN